MKIYLVVLNNGESYEDLQYWNSGIFSSLDQAIQHGFQNFPQNANDFKIEIWDLENNKLINEMEIKKAWHGIPYPEFKIEPKI